MKIVFTVGILLFFSQAIFAASPPRTVDPSPEQMEKIKSHHLRLRARPPAIPATNVERPFSDLETAGYLFFSAETEFKSAKVKKAMVKNLPADVRLVIYADPSDDVGAIREQYRGLIDPSRLMVVTIPGARSGFWTRDGLPVPVWNHGGGLEMVDASYYHGFEPDALVAGWFSAHLHRHEYYYEGGNFMTNDQGDCIMVDNDRAKGIPLEIFESLYGCRETIRLPFEKGIGHVDESVRFIRSRTVVTDSPKYAALLRSKGFEAIEVPRPTGYYQTYINSLIVNGTVFVPVFNEKTDAAAIRAYEAAGLKTIPIETRSLANDGHGSIHCITMTYPPVPFKSLLESLGATELN